jgi:hypothetical protein
MHLRRPDDLKASAFYDDPKQMMDLVLKTGYWYRQVGPEKIKVTSLGKPTTDTTYTDNWQRHWKVFIWPQPHINGEVIVFALPLPDGYAILMRINPSSVTHDSLIDMKALTDFYNVDYGGTLKQWKEFLGDHSLLPDLLKDVRIDFDEGKHFSYDSNKLAFSYPTTVQAVSADNLLGVGVGYYANNGTFSLEPADIQVRLNATDPDRVTIKRHIAPSADLDDELKQTWGKLLHKQHPYDGVAYNDGDEMDIIGVIDPPGSAAPTMLYTAFYGTQGPQKPEDMKSKLDLLIQQIKIKTH